MLYTCHSSSSRSACLLLAHKFHSHFKKKKKSTTQNTRSFTLTKYTPSLLAMLSRLACDRTSLFSALPRDVLSEVLELLRDHGTPPVPLPPAAFDAGDRIVSLLRCPVDEVARQLALFCWHQSRQHPAPSEFLSDHFARWTCDTRWTTIECGWGVFSDLYRFCLASILKAKGMFVGHRFFFVFLCVGLASPSLSLAPFPHLRRVGRIASMNYASSLSSRTIRLT